MILFSFHFRITGTQDDRDDMKHPKDTCVIGGGGRTWVRVHALCSSR